MTKELTQIYPHYEINKLYFTLRDYIKTVNNVNKLNELNITQQVMYKKELELLNKLSKL